MIRNRLTRPGITLIEMMVAMALSLGIMLILTESFKMALDFVRSANSTGELISQLNGAGILLTRDLKAEHFLPEDSKPNRGVKLADQRLDWFGAAPPKTWTQPIGPIGGGFFRIVAPAVPGPPETTDAQGFNINSPANPTTLPTPPYPAPGGHQLHFTSVLSGGVESNSFSTSTGGATYVSRAAEIAYFLAPTGKKTSVLAGGQDMYNLIRRQRLVALTTDERAALTTGAGDRDVISSPDGVNVNTMASVAMPANRMTLAPFPPGNARYGEDIVVSNVLSFEIQADWTPGTQGGSNNPPQSYALGNTDAPYQVLTQGGGVFDTGGTPAPPQYVQIKSLQITIRIYDPRLKQTRQNTWKFAM